MARYIIRKGDTINSIAKRAGISREEFIRLNGRIDTRGELESMVGFAVRLGEGNSIGDPAGQYVPLAKDFLGSGYDAEWAATYAQQSRQSNADMRAAEDYYRSPEYVDMMQEYVPGYTGYVPGSPEDKAALDRDEARRNRVADEDMPGVGPQDEPQEGGGDSGLTTTPETPTTAEEYTQDPESIVDAVMGSYPWLAGLGLRDFILGLVTDNPRISSTAIISQVRNNWGGYDELFPNIRRDDGTMRMNEATFLTTMDNYRRVLNRFDGLGDEYTRAQLSQFLANEIDVGELQDRLTVYDRIQRGGHDLKAAFYVYGGISLTDDDLYDMVVDPDYAGDVTSQYYANAQNLDYPTFLGRVTDIATQTTGTMLPRETAATVLDQLLHNGDPVDGEYLSLVELEAAFEAAMIGSAATQQGLALPDFSRIEQFRMAGINRTQALQKYGEYARDRDFFNAVVGRRDMGDFSQQNFESASFLFDPDQQRRLQRALVQEQSRGKGGTSFAFQNVAGRIAQGGMSAFRN